MSALKNDYAISTNQLSRVFQTTKKPEGLVNSIKAIWSREYKEKIALNKLSINIAKGQIVGLVGSNGAGKTTLLKLLSGLIHPSSGEISVLGFNPSMRQYQYLRQMSILLGQKNQLWWDIPAMDSYSLLATIYEVEKNLAQGRIYDLADKLNCRDLLTVPLRKLSLGERMKMEIIGSLLHSPKIIFLDEPTIGLDVVAQSAIRDFLKIYVEKERPTVILTSHYMDDIAQLAERLLVVSHGQMVYDGTVDTFMKKAKLNQKISGILQNPPQQDYFLKGDKKIIAHQSVFQLEVKVEEVSSVLKQILDFSPVHELKIEETDFEDVVREFMQSH